MSESIPVSVKNDKFTSLMRIIFGEKTFCFYIIASMIAIPLTEFISELLGYRLIYENIAYSICGIVGAFLCTGKIALNPTGKHWTDFFYFTLHIFMFLSLIYSCDITRPFRPDAPTNEYPQFFLGYYAMFYAGAQLSSKKLRKMVLATFVGLALFESVIGILQTLGIQIQPMLFAKTSNEFVYVLTQNTNIYGALCILFAGAIAGSFVFTTNRVHKIILGILFVPCIYCSYYTMSRLSWLGVMVMMCFLLVSILIMRARNKGDARYKGYLKSLGILFAILVVTAVSCYFLNVSESMARFQQTTEEISSAEGGNVSEIGSGRGVIWGFCFEALPRHWVTGVGLDNLYQCYIENHKWIQGMYYSNQAHNEYLQVLTTQGVFAFINYMAMLVLSGVFAVRRVLFNDDDEDRKITWIYLGMFAGFVVAMFFLFRTFTVEPYFCAVIGLMNPRVHKLVAAKAK